MWGVYRSLHRHVRCRRELLGAVLQEKLFRGQLGRLCGGSALCDLREQGRSTQKQLHFRLAEHEQPWPHAPQRGERREALQQLHQGRLQGVLRWRPRIDLPLRCQARNVAVNVEVAPTKPGHLLQHPHDGSASQHMPRKRIVEEKREDVVFKLCVGKRQPPARPEGAAEPRQHTRKIRTGDRRHSLEELIVELLGPVLQPILHKLAITVHIKELSPQLGSVLLDFVALCVAFRGAGPQAKGHLEQERLLPPLLCAAEVLECCEERCAEDRLEEGAELSKQGVDPST
mmetsp:Transcript_112757/g.318736  ORF Transcript_112757/g.318736 Transcript_112757/m.318736 type:complete len:286 (-) Transcript_112757:854-1711(-)